MTEASEKNGGRSRDRRKSKYLSYPYTNTGSRHTPDDTKDARTPCQKAEASGVACQKAEASRVAKKAKKRFNGSSSSFAKLGGKRFQRNWYRKLVSCDDISSSPEFIHTSPAELLSGLHSKAVDCMSSAEHKNSALVEWFFSRYRVSRYHDEAELATSLANMNVGHSGTPMSNDLQDIKIDKKRKNSKMQSAGKKKMKSLSGLLSDVKISSSAGNFLDPRRKLEQNKNIEVISLHQLQNHEMTLNDSSRKDSPVPEALQSLSISSLPDVRISSFTDNSRRPEKKLKPKKKVKEVISLHLSQNGETTSNDRDNKSSLFSQHRSVSSLLSSSIDSPLKLKLNLKKVEEAISLRQPQKNAITLNGSGRKDSSVPNILQNLSHLDSEEKVGSQKKKIEVAPEHGSAQIASAYKDAKITKCSSLVIDLQPTSQPRPDGISMKSNGGNREELVLMSSNLETCVSQQGQVGNSTNCGVSESSVSKVGTVLVNKTGGLKNGMEKVSGVHLNTKISTQIPDLNPNSSVSNSVIKEFGNVNSISLERKSEQPINLSACVRSTKTLNHSRMEENGETLKTCLLLQFAPGASVPSKEYLMSTFCRFGPLNASDTKLMKDTSSAQIVFVRSADAGEAFRSLEQNKPFGADLVDCKLHHLSAAASSPVEKFMTPTQPSGSMPMPMPKPKPGEKPSLEFIKQNLLMMISTMEKSGDSLSPQMRAKLDSEIKKLWEKVNSMGGS